MDSSWVSSALSTSIPTCKIWDRAESLFKNGLARELYPQNFYVIGILNSINNPCIMRVPSLHFETLYLGLAVKINTFTTIPLLCPSHLNPAYQFQINQIV